jgi:hypothetical protein
MICNRQQSTPALFLMFSLKFTAAIKSSSVFGGYSNHVRTHLCILISVRVACSMWQVVHHDKLLSRFCLIVRACLFRNENGAVYCICVGRRSTSLLTFFGRKTNVFKDCMTASFLWNNVLILQCCIWSTRSQKCRNNGKANNCQVAYTFNVVSFGWWYRQFIFVLKYAVMGVVFP